MIALAAAIAFALYLYAATHWLIRPAILDGSLFGVAAIVFVSIFVLTLLSAEQRRRWGAYAVIALAWQRVFASLPEETWLTWLPALLLSFVLLALISRVWGKLPWSHFLAAFGTAALLAVTPANEHMPYWTEFRVLWQSPRLANATTQPEFFPLRVAPIDRDGRVGIITMKETGRSDASASQAASEKLSEEERRVRPELERTKLTTTAYVWQNGRMTEIQPMELPPHWPSTLLQFPYWTARTTDVRQADFDLMPQVDHRLDIIGQNFAFVRLPWTSLHLAATTLDETDAFEPQLFPEEHLPPGLESVRLENGQLLGTWRGEPFTVHLAAQRLLGVVRHGDAPPLLLLQGKEWLLVRPEPPSGTVVHTIALSDVAPYGVKPSNFYTADIIVHDIDGDGYDDLLLNTQPATVWRQASDGRFHLHWISPKTSTRFETPVRLNGEMQWLVNAPSWVRNVPTRYLTGMVWDGNKLKQRWRIFPTSLINVQAADLTGDGQQEIVAQRYGQHRFIVLQKHGWPIVPAMYAVTLFGIVLLLIYSVRQGHWHWRRGWPAVLFAAALLVAARFSLPGTVLSSAPKVPVSPNGTTVDAAAKIDPLTRYFSETTNSDEQPIREEEVRAMLETALAKSEALERFRFTGWVANYTGRYQVNNMFDGFFVLPDQAAVDLRLAAKPYRYNQRGDDVLYYDQIEWQPLPGAAVHLQPFAGLERLAEYADRAVRLPDEAVLGEPSTVLRFRFTQAELNDIMGVGDSGAAELPDRTDSEGAAARVPEDTQLTLLLWIGQTDGTLRQVRSFSYMPVGAFGNFIQETYVRLWQLNDPTLVVLNPLDQ